MLMLHAQKDDEGMGEEEEEWGRQRTRHVAHLLLLEQHRLLLGAHVLDTMNTGTADAWRHASGHHRGRVDVRSSWA